MAFTLFSDIIKKMLEKKAEILYFDSHFHYFNCINSNSFSENQSIIAVSCSHTLREWEVQSRSPSYILNSFGIHPQNAVLNNLFEIEEMKAFLQKLLSEKKIICIGETGFDFYTEELKAKKALQEELWNFQLNLAILYKKPLVIHCRKANEKIFEYASQLKNLPSVLFHSFMGTSIEAKSLLNKGINGYFSFGKQIMNNNKKVIDCVKNLPLEKLLLETDAPFQSLEKNIPTKNSDIITVYENAFRLRKEIKPEIEYDSFCNQLKINFEDMFGINLK